MARMVMSAVDVMSCSEAHKMISTNAGRVLYTSKSVNVNWFRVQKQPKCRNLPAAQRSHSICEVPSNVAKRPLAGLVQYRIEAAH